MGVILTTYKSWDDPPSRTDFTRYTPWNLLIPPARKPKTPKGKGFRLPTIHFAPRAFFFLKLALAKQLRNFSAKNPNKSQWWLENVGPWCCETHKILVIFSNDRVYTSYFWVPQNVKKNRGREIGTPFREIEVGAVIETPGWLGYKKGITKRDPVLWGLHYIPSFMGITLLVPSLGYIRSLWFCFFSFSFEVLGCLQCWHDHWAGCGISGGSLTKNAGLVYSGYPSPESKIITPETVVSNIIYFHPETWGRFPFWLICFKWVETTN